MKKFALVALFAVLGTPLFASPSFLIDAMGKLNFLDETGKLKKTIENGAIAADIELGEQKFRVSYGRDLKGNPNIILYANPSEPSDITLNGFGKNIKILDGGVLTIVATPDGNDALMKSGVIGQVKLDEQVLKPNALVNVQEGETTDKPIFQNAKMVKKTKSGETAVDHGLLQLGATAHVVEGTVTVQYVGEEERPLVAGDVLKQGAIIRTGEDGNVYLSPYPNSLAWLEPSSEMEIVELSSDPKAGLEANILLGINKGTITSTLQGVDHSKVSYKIKTPRGTAAARGTTFSINNDNGTITGSVTEGNIDLNLDGGKISINVANGMTATATTDSGTPVQVTLTEAQIGKINAILNMYKGLFGNKKGGSLDDVEGTEGLENKIQKLANELEDTLDDANKDLQDKETTPTK